MKKTFIFYFLLVLCTGLAAQTDKALDERLNQYMQLNRELKFARLIDYIHPAVFKLASKQQLQQAFEQAFDNETVALSFDSLATVGVGKAFVHAGKTYRKVDYFMAMTMQVKDSSLFEDPGFADMMKNNLKTGFQKGEVAFDSSRRVFNIHTTSVMLAIKDNPQTPWMFLGIDANTRRYIDRVLPAAVIRHFGLK